jgi:hypothetical protein
MGQPRARTQFVSYGRYGIHVIVYGMQLPHFGFFQILVLDSINF